MKLSIGSGTLIEGKTIEFSGNVVILRGHKGKVGDNAPLLLAYCLREGETLRKVGDDEYQITI